MAFNASKKDQYVRTVVTQQMAGLSEISVPSVVLLTGNAASAVLP